MLDSPCVKAEGSGNYGGSVATALHCFHLIEQYANGERRVILTKDEVASCFDVHINTVGFAGGRAYNLLEVWEKAQWCRATDVQRWAGANEKRIYDWIHAGAITAENKSWFGFRRQGLAMPLSDAMLIKKSILLRPFLQRMNGVVDRLDSESLSLLPLDTLLGIITNRQLAQLMLTPYGPKAR